MPSHEPRTDERARASSAGPPRAPRLPRFTFIALFAFASGLPFGIFKDFLPLWLRDAGVSVESVGWLTLLAAPWSLKVLWSPLVDRYATRTAWIAASAAGAGLSLVALAVLGPEVGVPFIVLLGAFTLAAATQDIGVDAYTVDVTARGEEGPVNSLRVTLYRVAIVTAAGAAVLLAGFVGWAGALAAMGALLVGLGLVAPLARRHAPTQRALSWGELVRGLGRWFARPGAIPLAAFILLYKWPDAALGPMVRTFWVDAGLGVEAMGSLALPNLLATVAGVWLGGWIVARLGLLRGLLVCGVAQALSNLAYAGADLFGGGYASIFSAALVESGCGGMGTTAFLALLMRVCERERAASEYALMSALFALTRDLTGAFSGEGVAALGYAGWFGATTLFAIPGLLLLRVRALREMMEERRARIPEG